VSQGEVFQGRMEEFLKEEDEVGEQSKISWYEDV
jgi:hypothetical protein